MEQQFNKKRFWTIVALLALVETLVLFCVFQWRYIFPSHEVSEIYTRYENTDGIDASFIKDFRVNDSVFIDVTLLEAKDSAGWATLMHDFAVPDIDPKIRQHIYNKKELVFYQTLTPSHYPISIPSDTILFDVLAISYYAHTLTIFHSKNEKERHVVLLHDLDESTN